LGSRGKAVMMSQHDEEDKVIRFHEVAHARYLWGRVGSVCQTPQKDVHILNT